MENRSRPTGDHRRYPTEGSLRIDSIHSKNLTIADALLLLAGFATGFGLVRWMMVHDLYDGDGVPWLRMLGLPVTVAITLMALRRSDTTYRFTSLGRFCLVGACVAFAVSLLVRIPMFVGIWTKLGLSEAAYVTLQTAWFDVNAHSPMVGVCCAFALHRLSPSPTQRLDWLDRAGIAAGLFWVALPVARSLAIWFAPNLRITM